MSEMWWRGGVSDPVPLNEEPFDVWTVEAWEADGAVWLPSERKWRMPDGALRNGPGSDGS